MNNQFVCDITGNYEQPQQSNLASPAEWLMNALTRGESDTGVNVTWKNTLGLSSAWYCINLISDAIAQTPMPLYMRESRSERVIEDKAHAAGRSLRNPRGPVNAYHLRKTLTTHALLRGNGRAFIHFNGRQEPEAYTILDPDSTTTVTIYNDETDIRSKWHVVQPETGSPIPLPDNEVLHIFRTSYDGYNGVGVLDILRSPIGLGLAGEKDVSVRYKNSGNPSMMIECPSGMFKTQTDAEHFLEDFNKRHAGTTNSGRVGLLRAGMKLVNGGFNARDSQTLEGREFSVRELMRVFGVPVIPGVADSQSYNTLEQLNRALLIHCFGPWMKIWTTECGAKLLTTTERRTESHYFEFDTWDLIKPDASQLGAMLAQLKTSMLITSNEGRNWIDLPPHPDGDRLENPATTRSDQPATSAEPPAKQPPTDSQTNASQVKAIAARLAPLVRDEVTRVTEMASKARNFLDWMDGFYSKHLARTTEIVESLGGEKWIAESYIEHSREVLLEIAGGPPDTFADRAREAVAMWPARATELAERILNHE